MENLLSMFDTSAGSIYITNIFLKSLNYIALFNLKNTSWFILKFVQCNLKSPKQLVFQSVIQISLFQAFQPSLLKKKSIKTCYTFSLARRWFIISKNGFMLSLMIFSIKFINIKHLHRVKCIYEKYCPLRNRSKEPYFKLKSK